MTFEAVPGTAILPFDEARLHRFERWLEGSDYPSGKTGFDSAYVEFLRKFNGCVPVKRYLETVTGRKHVIEVFDHFAMLGDADPRRVHGVERSFSDASDGLGLHLIPFAELAFGDMLCFDYKLPGRPRIVVWFHDIPGTDDVRHTELVADNFDEFLDKLHFPPPEEPQLPFAALPKEVHDQYMMSLEKFCATNPAVAEDIRQLQGMWRATARYASGLPQLSHPRLILEFIGNRIREIDAEINQTDDYADCFKTFELFVSKVSKQMNLTYRWLNQRDWSLCNELVFPCLYEMRGNTLRIARGNPGAVPERLAPNADDYIEFIRYNKNNYNAAQANCESEN